MDGIFVFHDKALDISRLFAVLTLLRPKTGDGGEQKVEPLLSDSPLYRLDGDRLIVGLPSMGDEPPWVVNHAGDGDFMCVRSDLDFM